jgi:hypothetical protein
VAIVPPNAPIPAISVRIRGSFWKQTHAGCPHAVKRGSQSRQTISYRDLRRWTVYGQFSYTKKSHDADLGVLKVSIKEKETVDVPTWAGVAAIAAGAVLLFAGRKR